MGGQSAPDPAVGDYSTPPDPVARLRATLLKGREWTGGKGREGEVVPPLFGRKLSPCTALIIFTTSVVVRGRSCRNTLRTARALFTN